MKIIKPTIGGHDGSSFRELLDMWEERGYCEIVPGPPQRSEGYASDPDSPEAKCWVNEVGDILLYDFPLLDRLQHGYNKCLFANTYKEGPKNHKWIFGLSIPELMILSRTSLEDLTQTETLL